MASNTHSSPIFLERSDIVNLPFSVLLVVNIFKQYSYFPWLCYGALLGIIREQRLLPWNNDVELGLVCSEPIDKKKVKKILDHLVAHGFIPTYYSTSQSFSVRHPSLAIQINVNIFSVYNHYLVRPHEVPSQPENGYPFLLQCFWWISTILGAKVSVNFRQLFQLPLHRIMRFLFILLLQPIPRLFRIILASFFHTIATRPANSSMLSAIPCDYVFPIIPIPFYGSLIDSPHMPTQLLEYLYGEDWKVPKDNWSFYADKNKSISKVVYLPSKYKITTAFL